ncbi:hypothetical protein [Hyalangium versicolor]|uniref:hypothetical protein n=1 Tax=Hyalangium versicolor TaxID=2861190 RepID=UPI001CC98761|nr:hypothetical protein [Hyalangium versicolor]
MASAAGEPTEVRPILHKCTRCTFWTFDPEVRRQHHVETGHALKEETLPAGVSGTGPFPTEPPPETLLDKLKTAQALAENLHKVLGEVLEEPEILSLEPERVEEVVINRTAVWMRLCDIRRLVSVVQMRSRWEARHG